MEWMIHNSWPCRGRAAVYRDVSAGLSTSSLPSPGIIAATSFSVSTPITTGHASFNSQLQFYAWPFTQNFTGALNYMNVWVVSVDRIVLVKISLSIVGVTAWLLSSSLAASTMYKNSPEDEIANVNFSTTTTYM